MTPFIRCLDKPDGDNFFGGTPSGTRLAAPFVIKKLVLALFTTGGAFKDIVIFHFRFRDAERFHIVRTAQDIEVFFFML